MIGRIPILDVQPVVRVAGLIADTPAKAVPGESFMVTATVFREGHEMLGAGVVLTGPDGAPQPLVRMRELAEGTDRYGAQVSAGCGKPLLEAGIRRQRGQPVLGHLGEQRGRVLLS